MSKRRPANTIKNPHAQALGQLGGTARAARMTPAERQAAAAYAGKYGGWPKGRPRGPRRPKAS